MRFSMTETPEKPRILFACKGNTCRSVLAEYISRARFRSFFVAASAGFKPQPPEDAENAIYTLRSFLNIDASNHYPRGIRQVGVKTFDFVVAMDSAIAKKFRALFPEYPEARLIKWKINDPWGDNLAEYRRCAQAIFAELKTLPLVKGDPEPRTTA